MAVSITGSTFDFGGGVSGNAYEWNSGTRQLIVHPKVVMIDPEETPLFSLLDDEDTKTASYEWQKRSLAAPAGNAQQEGRSYSFADPNIPTRLQNVTQIFSKSARVTGTTQAEAHYHTADVLKDQTSVRMTELKRDYEYEMLNATLSVSDEAGTGIRETRGILESISTNATAKGGTPDLSETDLKELLLQKIWEAGPRPNVVVLTAVQQNHVDQFLGSGGAASGFQIQDTPGGKKRTSHVKMYDSPFGMVDIVLTRDHYLNDGVVVAMDTRFWHKKWLRKTFVEKTPKDGDYWSVQLTGEMGMKDDNELAGAKITGLSTS